MSGIQTVGQVTIQPFEYQTSNVSGIQMNPVLGCPVFRGFLTFFSRLSLSEICSDPTCTNSRNILNKFFNTNPDMYDNRGVTLIGWGSNKKGGAATPKLSRATLVVYKYK